MRALPDPTRRQRFRPTCTVSEKSVKRGGGLVSGVPAVVSGPATLAPKDEPDGRLGLETNEVRVSAASPGECCASCAARLGACWTTKKRPAEATLDGAGWMCGSAAEGSNNGRRASSCASGTVATPQGVAIGSAEVLQVQTSMWCVVVASRNCPSGENATLQCQGNRVTMYSNGAKHTRARTRVLEQGCEGRSARTGAMDAACLDLRAVGASGFRNRKRCPMGARTTESPVDGSRYSVPSLCVHSTKAASPPSGWPFAAGLKTAACRGSKAANCRKRTYVFGVRDELHLHGTHSAPIIRTCIRWSYRVCAGRVRGPR